MAIVDRMRVGPAFWCQQMDEPGSPTATASTSTSLSDDVAEARIAAALAADGTLVSDRAARAFWILADPDGNEACMCIWQDRD